VEDPKSLKNILEIVKAAGEYQTASKLYLYTVEFKQTKHRLIIELDL
jgi:hypothetical protein